MRTIDTPVSVILFIVLLPILIPFAWFEDLRNRRRIRTASTKFKCIQCGALLGWAAKALADSEWDAYITARLSGSPGIRLRILRSLHAICTLCGQKYKFSYREGAFSPI